MTNYLLVGLGGALGAMLRYFVQSLVVARFGTLPSFGTWLANITGCLLFGLISSYALRHTNISPEWRLFLLTGICGGYTTFSTFTAEALQFLQQGQPLLALFYISSTLLLGFFALWLAIQV